MLLMQGLALYIEAKNFNPGIRARATLSDHVSNLSEVLRYFSLVRVLYPERD